MIRLAANLSFLFAERPFADRFAAAASAGFRHVEWNFAYDVADAELARRLVDNGLSLCLLNTPPGDAAAGELGLGALAGREAECAAAFDRALQQAVALGAPMIHFLAGNPDPQADPAAVDALFLENLTRAADLAAMAGVTLTLEPLNRRDRPRYHLATVDHALRLIALAARPNVRLQLDLYHCQITEGDILRLIERTLPLIGHVQIAGVPDRNEPSAGELACPVVLHHLDRLGYRGLIGCEYVPAADTLSGLEWARPWLEPTPIAAG